MALWLQALRCSRLAVNANICPKMTWSSSPPRLSQPSASSVAQVQSDELLQCVSAVVTHFSRIMQPSSGPFFGMFCLQRNPGNERDVLCCRRSTPHVYYPASK